jgi:hypothetical protein
VAQRFQLYPAKIRPKLLALRELIFQTARSTDGVGEIKETLKWGEPAYLTPQTQSGSTIRIDWMAFRPTEYAMYFHCQTNLVETFRATFPNEFRFEGNRAILFREDDAVPMDPLAFCVGRALTYHRTSTPSKPSPSRTSG